MRLRAREAQNFLLSSYAFSLNIENWDPFSTGGLFSISKLMGIFYLGSIALSPAIYLAFSTRLIPYLWPKIALIILITIMSALNINYYSSKILDFSIILNFFIFIAIINHAIIDRKAINNAFLYFAVGSIFVSFLIFFDVGVTFNQEGRLVFFDAGINELALKLLCGLFIIFSFFFSKEKKYKNISLLLLWLSPLIVIAIISSGSRTALLLIFATAIYLFLINLFKSERKILAFMTGSILIALLSYGSYILFVIYQDTSVVIERLVSTGGARDFGEGGRFALWSVFFTSILEGDNKLMGYGMSGYELISFQKIGAIESPHNVFLEILLYSGIMGLALYLLFLYRVFKAALGIYINTKNNLAVMLFPFAFIFIFVLQGLSEKLCWIIFAYIISNKVLLINSIHTNEKNSYSN
ncbi:MAG: hypothetical protein CMF41_05190 [Legionellales bacterium]|nr:hypothetical protein [Legionellales bacterium]OUX64670.1 MAG: hypothetical protein CBE41_02845 [Gammaproteobacteria bacterium TMED281]